MKTKRLTIAARRVGGALLVILLCALAVPSVEGQQRPATRNTTRTNINSGNRTNVNVNSGNRTNVNVNTGNRTNVNVNVNGGYRGGYYGGGYYHSGPSVGAVVAGAIVVGAIVATLPPSCTTIMANGFAYQNCGGVYYQPRYSGSSVTYVVVNHP
ncbi:MAG: DUF6515 family protein [Vicinamibacteria bacterium]